MSYYLSLNCSLYVAFPRFRNAANARPLVTRFIVCFAGSSLVHQMFTPAHRIPPTTSQYDPVLATFTPEQQSAHHAAFLAVREHLPASGITRR